MKRAKQQTTRRSNKKIKVFAELREALRDALGYEQGKKPNLRVTKIPPAPRTEQLPNRRG